MKEKVIFSALFISVFGILGNFAICKAADDDKPEVSIDTKKSDEVCERSGIWSQLLEDYTLSLTKPRESRAWGEQRDVHHPPHMYQQQQQQHMNPHPGQMNVPHPPHSHQQLPQPNRFVAPQGFHITKRIGEATNMELEPHMRPPAKLINSPTPFRQNFQPNGNGGVMGQQHPAHLREVSETDLYLLGAIEKLVYRVDYLEARLRRSEQIIYYLMAGNNQKEVRDPCRANFTRIGDNCYHINGVEQVNWKTANTACRGMGAFLAEFEKVAENEELMAYILNNQDHKGKDFWLGALNPGLLWIWANSAKPVNPNTNVESFVNSTQSAMETADSSENDISKTTDEEKSDDDKILNNTLEIKGKGRCLRLSYNTAKQTYYYFGQECTSRHYYMCEYEDKSTENKIKKLSRDLKLDV